MKPMNPLVNTLVQHIMVCEEDVSKWRRQLIQNHIFEPQEAKDLSDREISLIHHALLVQRYSQMSSDEINTEAKRYNLQYKLHLDTEDFQMGAVCY